MLSPKPSEYNSYFQGYVSLVSGNTFKELKDRYNNQICKFWKTIPDEKWSYSYAKGKWTLKRVLQHIIDTERIMSYRALCIVRNDKQNLNEFEQDQYAIVDNSINRNFDDIIKEWESLRGSNNLMFESLSKNDLTKSGNIGSKKLSVRAIIYIIFGHALHHINIINEKYLNEN